jgi:hypothetical protein
MAAQQDKRGAIALKHAEGTDATASEIDDDPGHRPSAAPVTLALAVVSCPEEPARLGELLVLPGASSNSPRVFGRGAARADDPHSRLTLVRDRPSGVKVTAPLGLSWISRVQLVLTTRENEVHIRNVGRCSMSLRGNRVAEATLKVGDVVQLGARLMMLCVQRPAWVQSAGDFPEMPFGEPDAFGMVGESAAMWKFRRSLMFVARQPQHILVHGGSGTGKELAARAVHVLSSRARGPLVARNAATLPEGLVDAELFGNAKNYPNTGLPERPGLVGEAHGGTLFLDEFAELPAASQSHLLRVLDGGDYQRLGESTARRSDFRLVAATNRDPSILKHDLLARLPLRLIVPDLNARREDIPLLVRHFLRKFERESPDVARRVFVNGVVTGEPSVPADVMANLVVHRYTTHIRELEALLLRWLSGEETSTRPESSRPGNSTGGHRSEEDSDQPTAREIQDCLERHNGILDQTWPALGLKNRHALARLIAKYGIEVTRRPGGVRRRRK